MIPKETPNKRSKKKKKKNETFKCQEKGYNPARETRIARDIHTEEKK